MTQLSALLKHYKREDIREALIAASSDKEVAVKFGEKGFGKRPDTLKYSRDVLEFAKQGATSFHCSEELWTNPLQISPALKKNELDHLRKGWDLILDIDCQFLEYSQIAADLLVKALKYHGMNSISVKFSGNHGFHIGVPFAAFPENVYETPTKNLFPEGPRKIAFYLKEMIGEHLSQKITEIDDIDKIIKKSKKELNELVKKGKFDPFSILDIDTLLISSRHLYRMPYCFNEKSGLISIPIDPNKILDFEKEHAKPENVEVNKFIFLDRPKVVKNEAKQLIVQAFDFETKREEVKISKNQEYITPETAVPEQFFPPCINNILKGLDDGKKRAVFVLINFLSSVGWDYDKIEKTLNDWNKRNAEPLREVYVLGQLRYHKQNKKKVLPPNCPPHNTHLKDMLVCVPDSFCPKIKNPVSYALRKTRFLNKDKGEDKKKKK